MCCIEKSWRVDRESATIPWWITSVSIVCFIPLCCGWSINWWLNDVKQARFFLLSKTVRQKQTRILTCFTHNHTPSTLMQAESQTKVRVTHKAGIQRAYNKSWKVLLSFLLFCIWCLCCPHLQTVPTFFLSLIISDTHFTSS